MVQATGHYQTKTPVTGGERHFKLRLKCRRPGDFFFHRARRILFLKKKKNGGRKAAGLPRHSPAPRPVCLGAFLVCTLLNCGLFFLSKHPSTAGAMKALGIQTVVYESPFTFLAAVSLFLWFEKCHFTSHIVNLLAASSLSIYVIHKNPLVFPYFKDVCLQIFGDFDGVAVLAVMAGFLLAVMAGSLLLDQLRLWAWKGLEKSVGARFALPQKDERSKKKS